MWEADFQKLVSDYLKKSRLKNVKFSQRALAKKLLVSSSTLSDLVNGRRHVSAKKALSILNRLPEVDPIRRAKLEMRIQSSFEKRVPLNKENYDIILEWVFLGILCVLELDNAPHTSHEIGDALGVNIKKIESALARLTKLGMIKKNLENRYTIECAYFETTDEIADSRIAEAHINDMDKAKDALRRLPPQLRDFTSLVVSGDMTRLAAAKKLARRFFMQLSRTLTGSQRNEVYKISLQIYPLTQKNTGTRK